MANVSVKDNHLTFGGLAYFRGHAEEVEIGSIGEKRTPLSKQNYLEVKDHIPVPKIAVAKATVMDIDFTSTAKSAFNTAVSAIVKGVPVKFDGDTTFDKLRAGDLKLVKFSVANNDMKKAANESQQRLRDLIEWGDDARIAHQVFIVADATLANQVGGNSTVNLSAGVKGIEVQLGGSHASSSTTTVQLSKGTCFAYLLAKIDWDAKQKKDKTRIVDLDDDQWSFG